MMSIDWIIWKTLVVILIVALLYQLVMRKNKKNNLAPGPRALPFLGHFHLMGKNLHQNLYKLSEKYGPVMYIKFGVHPHIIVSSPQAAEQFLKIHDLAFASRPRYVAQKYMFYGQRDFAFAEYGPYWRHTRKLCTLQLLSHHKINSFKYMRRKEVGMFVESLKLDAQNHVVVDLSAKVASLITDLSCMMIFGKKFADKDIDEKGFKGVINEIFQLAGAFNLGDYFPYLGLLDIQGLMRKSKAISKVVDTFLERIIVEHEEMDMSGKAEDFVDTMMAVMKYGEAEFPFERSHVKANLLVLLVASVDTSSKVIEWTMSELFRHPRVLKKVVEELEEVVGLDRTVEESDLDKLKYLDMVVKESLRLHPAGPLLLPHEAMQDCRVNGFDIMKKSRIFINVWAIGRDPDTWSDPEKFIPERFIGSNIEMQGRDFQLIPFGSGRRSCPGMQLGLLVVQLVIAQLIYCFDWKLPDGMIPADLDMTECLGTVLARAKPLMAIPSYRLPK